MNQHSTELHHPIAEDHQAIAGGVAWVERSDRGGLFLGGKDRLTWLNGMCTADLRNLQPGDGTDAYLLNVKGRILFDVSCYIGRESLLLTCQAAQEAELAAHLDRYIIMEDVQVEPAGAAWKQAGLAGPRGAELLASIGLDRAGHLANSQHMQARIPVGQQTVQMYVLNAHFCGAPSWELLYPAEHAAAVEGVLHEAGGRLGLRKVGPEAVEIARIEAGRAGPAELAGEVIPNETAQDHRMLSFTKGCYLGQEIVFRIKHQGQPARLLRGLRFPEGQLPPPGSELQHEGRRVGVVTSVARSPRFGAIGMGYLRRPAYEQDQPHLLAVLPDGPGIPCQSYSLPLVPQPN